MARLLLPIAALAMLLAGCGGNVLVDGATTSSGTTTSGTSGTTTSSIAVPCASHDDCPSGWLCLFSTATCAPACEPDGCGACAAGSVCSSCATSSGPGDFDCLAACLPTQPGQCDDSDACPQGQICLWWVRRCATACDDNSDCGGFEYCESCATGSCCGCEDCVGACMGGE